MRPCVRCVHVRAFDSIRESSGVYIYAYVRIGGYEQVLYSLFIFANARGWALWMSDTSYGNCFLFIYFFLSFCCFFFFIGISIFRSPFAVAHSSATRDIFRYFSWNSIKVYCRCENHNSRSFAIHYIGAIYITIYICFETRKCEKRNNVKFVVQKINITLDCYIADNFFN